MDILLNDLLKIDNLSNVKVRFNMKNRFNYDPIKFFKSDISELFKGQFWNSSRRSFQVGDIALGFARIENDKWLLFDISRITKDLKRFNNIGYEYTTLTEYEKFFGRLIISYHNKGQRMVRNANTVFAECKVSQILEDRFDNDIFPGYENVNLSWEDLKRVVNKEIWKTALENQKGIYLITDKGCSKMYIGAAFGDEMILGRWKQYVKNGNGGNTDLKGLSFDYIKKNFRYTILEIYKSTIDDNVIRSRESWWKDVLQTRGEKGYNKN